MRGRARYGMGALLALLLLPDPAFSAPVYQKQTPATRRLNQQARGQVPLKTTPQDRATDREVALMQRLAAVAAERDRALVAGDRAAAAAAAREATAITRAYYGANSVDYVEVYSYEANLLIQIGAYDRAIAIYDEVAPLIQQQTGENSSRYVTNRSMVALAHLYAARGVEAEAITRPLLARAEQLFGPASVENITLINLTAQALRMQDRTVDAMPLFERGLSLMRSNLSEDYPQFAQFLTVYAIALYSQGRFAEAERVAAEAVTRTERRGQDPAAITDRLLAKQTRAQAFIELDRLDEAETILTAAIAEDEAFRGRDHPDSLEKINALGMLKGRKGDVAAEGLLQRVHAARMKLDPDSFYSVVSGNNLATYYLDNDRFAQAIPYLEEADRKLGKLRPANDPMAVNIGVNLAIARMKTGAAAQTAVEPARRGYRAQQARIDRLGNGLSGEAARSSTLLMLRGASHVFSEAAFQQAAAQPAQLANLRAEAFIANQNLILGSVNAAIQRQAARKLAALAGPELERAAREQQDLSDEWLDLNSQLTVALAQTGKAAAAARAPIEARLAEVDAAIAQRDALLARDAPAYVSLVRNRPLTEAEASTMLAADEALLMITPGTLSTQVMLVTREGARWHRSPKTVEQVNFAVERMLWFAGASVTIDDATAAQWMDEVPGDNAFDRKLAYSMWQELVEPLLPDMKGKSQLFIAASGSLAKMPFGMLVSAPPQGADDDAQALRATRWFADDFAITQVPSPQALALLRQARASARPANGFSGWGDPLLDGVATRRGGRTRSASGVTMASAFGTTRSPSGKILANIAELKRMFRLPGTADELNAMRAAFNAPIAAVRLGADATEAAVKQADLGNAAVIAFATHGLTAGEISSAAEPGLVFTPPAAPNDEDDGLLTASEVAALNLNADWVILSACNTAAGDGNDSSGLSGLARAFFFAGARNLLVSHWPVRDDVAARLTVRTVEIARDNPDLSRAQAFQRAMREIRQNTSADADKAAGGSWAHPNAWAPFTLIGDGAVRGVN